MWTTLALTAALSLAPGQSGQLVLSNVRTTYGSPGVSRPDAKLLPGDALFLSFDIEGITVDSSGKVLYTATSEYSNSQGKVLFKKDEDVGTVAALGGNTVSACQRIDVGLDQPPGMHTAKVTVTDRASHRSQTLVRNFEVLPKAFGLVRLMTTCDVEGKSPTSAFQSGGSVWFNAAAVAFARNGPKGQPDVSFELRVLDEDGRPTLAKPFSGEIKDKVPAAALGLPVQWLLTLNRPGKFTVEVKATDLIAQKTA